MANKEQTAQIDNKALKEALTTLKNERTENVCRTKKS